MAEYFSQDINDNKDYNKNNLFIREFLKNKTLFVFYEKETEYFFSNFHHLITKKHLLKNDEENLKFFWKYCDFNEKIFSTFRYKINWKNLIQNKKVPETFIQKYIRNINWNTVYAYKRFYSDDFIRKNDKLINWKLYSNSGNLVSLDIFKEFKDKISWSELIISEDLPNEFFKEFKKYVNINNFYIGKNFPDKFLEEHKNEINWKNNALVSIETFCKYYKEIYNFFQKKNYDNRVEIKDILNIIDNSETLNYDFFEIMENHFDFLFVEIVEKSGNFRIDPEISREMIYVDNVEEDYDLDFLDFSHASENDILEYPNVLLNYKALRNNKNLSEGFIKKHKDLMNWKNVFKNYNLSKEFILDHEQYIDFTDFLKNKKDYKSNIPIEILIKKCKTKNHVFEIFSFNENFDKYNKMFSERYFKNFEIDNELFLEDFKNVSDVNKKTLINVLNKKNLILSKEFLKKEKKFLQTIDIDFTICNFIRFYGFAYNFIPFIDSYSFYAFKLKKIIFLQKKIKDWLYKPNGLMYKKTLENFKNLHFD